MRKEFLMYVLVILGGINFFLVGVILESGYLFLIGLSVLLFSLVYLYKCKHLYSEGYISRYIFVISCVGSLYLLGYFSPYSTFISMLFVYLFLTSIVFLLLSYLFSFPGNSIRSFLKIGFSTIMLIFVSVAVGLFSFVGKYMFTEGGDIHSASPIFIGDILADIPQGEDENSVRNNDNKQEKIFPHDLESNSPLLLSEVLQLFYEKYSEKYAFDIKNSTGVTFKTVSKDSPVYSYFAFAYQEGLIGVQVSPDDQVSCKTFFVMLGLLAQWNVDSYVGDGIFDAYWKIADQSGLLLSGCNEQNKILSSSLLP